MSFIPLEWWRALFLGGGGHEGKPPSASVSMLQASQARVQQKFSAPSAYLVKTGATVQAGLFENTNDVIKADPNPILLPFVGKITN